MYSHAPKNYQCPFCKISNAIEDVGVFTKQEDIIYKDHEITAFISSHWWPNNKGHVIIIPNQHFENIYSLQDNISNSIHHFEKQVAIAFKKIYKCDGVSSRQHNEPSGNQDVWHYHLHVFPRYENDNLYKVDSKATTPKQRKPYAKKLQNYFRNHNEPI